MERTKSISIKNLRLYKAFSMFLFGLWAFSYIFRFYDFGVLGWIMSAIFFAFAVYYWNPRLGQNLNRLKEIAYDSENLYIIENETEEQIPFIAIRDVEIVSLGGIYRFNFLDKNLHKGWITCKTSMWYPFNFKTVDKELNRVRALIAKAHRNYTGEIGQERGLASFN
jgi:hypothetical protein